jgi:hypothetical protein
MGRRQANEATTREHLWEKIGLERYVCSAQGMARQCVAAEPNGRTYLRYGIHMQLERDQEIWCNTVHDSEAPTQANQGVSFYPAG